MYKYIKNFLVKNIKELIVLAIGSFIVGVCLSLIMSILDALKFIFVTGVLIILIRLAKWV